MKNQNSNNQTSKISYFKIGLTAFLVICAVILFFFAVFKLDVLVSLFNKTLTILQPVILGIVIAFLVNPMAKFFQKNINKFLNKIFKTKNKFSKTSTISGIVVALLIFVLIISVFFYLVIPEFANTIVSLINILPSQFNSVAVMAEDFIKSNSHTLQIFNNLTSSLQNWFQTNFISNATTYATYLANGVINVVNFVVDFAIGLIVAVYILCDKKTLKLQGKKILYALFNKNRVESIITGIHKSNAIFSGFINGKLINALIIGILCFVGSSILGLPYVMLISVVIAVTDIIPIFGPYIGAIPCALLILLNNPIKCLYFVIFIIVLQVFDGNVIGPKILGESTGLSAFWVIVAIMLGGGLFGIIGMLIGVPVFAVLYYIAKTVINSLLAKKNINFNNTFAEQRGDLGEQNTVNEAE